MAVDSRTVPTDVSEIIGPFGLYQKLFTLWIVLFGIFTAMATMCITLMTPNMEYICTDPDFENSVDQCKLTLNTTSPDVTQTKECHHWTYSSRDFAKGSTLTEKFNLVCDQEWYISLASSVQQVGDLFAGMSVSYLSDRFGRRPICFLCIIPGAIGVFMFVFVQDVKLYIVAKFFYGFTGLSVNYLVMVILMETCGVNYRGFFSLIAGSLGYATGYTILPGIYYYIRDEHNFHIFLVCLFCVVSSFVWLVPESPRWLLVKQKNKRCFKLIKWIRKFNSLPIDDEQIKADLETVSKEIQIQAQKAQNTGFRIFDIFRGKEMTKRSLIIFLAWFVVGLIYLGVALTADALGGSLFLNVFLLAFIELPSLVFCLLTERYLGRKTLLSGLLLATAVVYFVTIAVPKSLHALQIFMVVLAKFCVNSSYNFVYPYTPELFPTSIRSTGVGIAGGFSSVGAVLGPFFIQVTEYTSLAVTFGIFGVLALISGSLVLFLPETKDEKLAETLGDIQSLNVSPVQRYMTIEEK